MIAVVAVIGFDVVLDDALVEEVHLVRECARLVALDVVQEHLDGVSIVLRVRLGLLVLALLALRDTNMLDGNERVVRWTRAPSNVGEERADQKHRVNTLPGRAVRKTRHSLFVQDVQHHGSAWRDEIGSDLHGTVGDSGKCYGSGAVATHGLADVRIQVRRVEVLVFGLRLIKPQAPPHGRCAVPQGAGPGSIWRAR